MKRKQTQSTLFECFRMPAPKATAASGDTSSAADDTIIIETPENEADAIVKLPDDERNENPWPALWTESQAREFKNRHPWLEWRDKVQGNRSSNRITSKRRQS